MPNKSKKPDSKEAQRPAQSQRHQPGVQSRMTPAPDTGVRIDPHRRKLEGRVALITGGDSGIGRAVAVAFAKEGADVAVVYLEEHEDARETRRLVEAEGRRCVLVAGDIGRPAFCQKAVDRAVKKLGRLDVLVNNAAEQHKEEDFEEIDLDNVERTFRTNILSMFALTKFALPHLRRSAEEPRRRAEKGGQGARGGGKDGDEGAGPPREATPCVINTTSVTAYRGSPSLVDYSSTKGAIVSFTRPLSGALAEEGIRVNAVAPGPIWTPLIPATFKAEDVKTFGSDVPLKRAGEPAEVAPAYVFLASGDASCITGQVIHVNGGEIVNG
jgi:NAD(P)-dependent dehydrogenase (short-subunit alcohol dehydrogenase family)